MIFVEGKDNKIEEKPSSSTSKNEATDCQNNWQVDFISRFKRQHEATMRKLALEDQMIRQQTLSIEKGIKLYERDVDLVEKRMKLVQEKTAAFHRMAEEMNKHTVQQSQSSDPHIQYELVAQDQWNSQVTLP